MATIGFHLLALGGQFFFPFFFFYTFVEVQNHYSD